ncbi:MAG: hypothetical protein MJ232_07460, partial [archaeon]|nr:hypothetical protein [archaeon]
NILTIVHKSSIEKVKEEDLKKGLEKIKGFIYLYLVFFIFSCIFLFWTKWPPCLFFMFLPFVGVFSPVGKKFKEGFVLIRFKEFYFLLLFSCIFSIFVFMLFKGCSIIYTIEFIMGILCWISFVILYFHNCWLEFKDLEPSLISEILVILFPLIGIVLFRFIGFR